MALVNFDLEVVASDTIKALSPITLPLAAFARKVSSDVDRFSAGDRVKVPLIGAAQAAAQFNAGANNYTTDNSTNDTVGLVDVDSHLKSSFPYTPEEWMKVTPETFQLKLKSHAESVVTAFVTEVMNDITLANFGAPLEILANANWTYDDVVDLVTAYKALARKTGNIRFVLNSAMLGALLKDGAIADASAFGGMNIAQTGKIDQVSGLTLFECDFIPANAQNLSAFITNGDGIAWASTIVPKHESFKGVTEVMTDPDTGLQLLVSIRSLESTDNIMTTVEMWGGSGVARAAMLGRVQSA